MRIAIVDDNPIVCQSLETILTATGTAEVLWMANDGDAAVRRYFETPASRPDVIPTFRQRRCANRGRNFVRSKR